MKKLSILLLLTLVLSSCGTATSTTKTVVVDQNGNVLETKISNNGMKKIGTLSFQGYTGGNIFEDGSTGCQYVTWDRGISPYYDINGNVTGCKNINSKALGK